MSIRVRLYILKSPSKIGGFCLRFSGCCPAFFSARSSQIQIRSKTFRTTTKQRFSRTLHHLATKKGELYHISFLLPFTIMVIIGNSVSGANGAFIPVNVKDKQGLSSPKSSVFQNEKETFAFLQAKHHKHTRAYTEEAVARLEWSREEVLAHQTQQLRKVISHAKANSPYYSKTLTHVDTSKVVATDLSSLPILTKQDIMDNWDDVVTDPCLSLKAAQRHLEDLRLGRTENPYYMNKYLIFATGGTSGKRGVFVWDWEMTAIAANLEYRHEARYDAKHVPTQPKRTAVICAGSYVHASRVLFPTMLDPEREVRVFPADSSIRTLVQEFNKYRPDRIVGYSSIVEELALQAEQGNLNIAPEWVSTNSEPLEDSAREAAKKAWGIDIHNSWGSVEMGMAAYEGETFGSMSLAEDYLIIEVVDENNSPVCPSRPEDAKKCLVTRLYGGTMPLIRYEVTDTIRLESMVNSNGEDDLHRHMDVPGVRRIKRIEGRSDIWFDYKAQEEDDGQSGVRVHPMVFRSLLGQKRQIIEYQVQQTMGGAKILVVAEGEEVPLSAIESELYSSLVRAGLKDPVIGIQLVDSLPRHAETSKLKRFVPLA